MRQALEAADFPAASLITTGMGWTDGPRRIRDFRRRAVGGGRVYVGPRLLIRKAMVNARTVANSMGAEQIIKGGSSGRRLQARDDVAVAALLALSEGARKPSTQPQAPPRGSVEKRHYASESARQTGAWMSGCSEDSANPI